MQLREKPALVREGSGYSRNRTPMGVSISVLEHLTHNTVHSEAKLNFNGELRCNATIWRQWWLMG